MANNLLKEKLGNREYRPTRHTSGLWKHEWRPLQFILVVDNFGVQYVGAAHATHLVRTLQKNYEISTDWGGTLYYGIKLKWNHQERTVETSMLE